MTAETELHGALVVDKLSGMTSHDAVALARRALGTKRVGHSGTLDPLATGVLLLLVGDATKLASYMGEPPKRYEATLELGVATSSLDADGEVTERKPVPALCAETVSAAARRFVGEHLQQVPMVSAVKVAGRPLYKAARQGHEVDAPRRLVELSQLDARLVSPTTVALSLRCGKGFYVRSLGRDLARELGTVGHLTRLRRTHNAGFDAGQAASIEQLRAARTDPRARAALVAALRPLSELCRLFQHVMLDARGAQLARHGKRIEDECVRARVDAGMTTIRVALEAESGAPVAIVDQCADGWRVRRGFAARG